MQINHFSQISNICKFNKKYYYKFVALLSSEDFDSDYPIKYKVDREHILYTWLVEDETQLEEAIQDMYLYVKFFKCRIYFYVDPKDKKKFLKSIRDKSNSYLDLFLNNKNNEDVISSKTLLKIFNTAQGSISSVSNKENKFWVFKTGTNEYSVMDIERMCGEHHVITLKGVKGYNIIANKNFNPTDNGFKELAKKHNIEIKQNPRIVIAKL